MFNWTAIKWFTLGAAAGIVSHRSDYWAGAFLACFVIANGFNRTPEKEKK